MHLGAETTLSTVNKIAAGDVQGIPQLELTEGELKKAPKIFKPDCEIDFLKEAGFVHDFIRGLSPYPAAWCKLKNTVTNDVKTFKIFLSEKTDKAVGKNAKIQLAENGILFPCSDFYVLITELQPEGKRKMVWKEFVAWNDVAVLEVG